jgi:hypothetical protein
MHEVRCRTASLGRLLRSKIRYWVILQLIPLIALCCVLQRNGKPSHPSRHVVEAVVHRKSKRSSVKRRGAHTLSPERESVANAIGVGGRPVFKNLPLMKARR